MKISYKTYPALKLLTQGQHEVALMFDEADKYYWEFLKDAFIPRLNSFVQKINRDNVVKPSKAFIAAAYTAFKNSLHQNESEFATALDGESGVLLRDDQTIFFLISKTPANNIVVEFVVFHNEENTLIAFCWQQGETVNKQGAWFSETVSFVDLPDGTPDSIELRTLLLNHAVIVMMLFKKYAQIETKVFRAGQKSRIGQRPVNSTKVNVTYLDSKWFTNLVRSEGFDVRGHFRLQACGTERKERRLTWINPFRKTGYTAPARKTKAESI